MTPPERTQAPQPCPAKDRYVPLLQQLPRSTELLLANKALSGCWRWATTDAAQIQRTPGVTADNDQAIKLAAAISDAAQQAV